MRLHIVEAGASLAGEPTPGDAVALDLAAGFAGAGAARAAPLAAGWGAVVAPVDDAGQPDRLAAALAMHAAFVVLEDARDARDVARLDARLCVAEAEANRPQGSTPVVALVAGSPAAVLALPGLAEASARLRGLAFDGEALARSLSPAVAAADRAAILAEGRLRTLLAAEAAGVAFYDVGRQVPGGAPEGRASVTVRSSTE